MKEESDSRRAKHGRGGGEWLQRFTSFKSRTKILKNIPPKQIVTAEKFINKQSSRCFNKKDLSKKFWNF